MGRFTSRKASTRPFRTISALTAGFLLFGAAAAFADAPNPTSATATSVTNANGSTTVTVTGTWTWLNSRGCDRPTGFAIDWNDPQQPGNVVGTLNGITYDVGAAAANAYNAADNLIRPMTSCTVTAGRANGTWGPISHTYAPGVSVLTGCAVTYDNKGGTAGGPGHQTDNSVEENNNAPGSDGCFTIPPPPVASITTQSSPDVSNAVPGVSATDTATVTGTGATPTGTVSFWLCNPSQVTAAGCPAGAGTQVGGVVTLSGGTATSAATTATTTPGTYCWRAVYSGDARYASKQHTNATIGANGECFQVAKRVPTISTTSNPTGTVVAPGASVTDTATITGSAGTPTGTMSFWLCSPAEVTAAGCPSGAGTAVGGPVTLVNGSATSTSTIATLPGTYCWRVSYSGDAVYDAGTHTNASSECFTVGLRSVTITTQSNPSANVAPGTSATDTATVSGAAGTPTGTVTFFLCGPGVSTAGGCATGGSQVGSPIALVNGNATSPATTATSSVGRYCWRAQYSGDAIYAASTHTNGTTECFDVAKRDPSIQTTASATGIEQQPGVSVSDTALLSGSAGTPSGTVTFFLCAPSQVTASGCATGGTQVGTPITLSGSGSATSATTNATTATGTYCWRAEYSGDAIYSAASHTNTTSECFTVVSAPPAPLDPTMTTTSNPSGAGVLPGASVVDLATVAGDPGAPVPTGTVTFFLCGPSTVSSSGCPTGTQIGGPVTLDGNGRATSPATTATTAIGTHCWRAVYSGDSNYLGAAHTNATSECFTTQKAAPSIQTVPKPSRAEVGDRIHDTASVAGGSAPTGNVTFRLYAPKDDDCSGSPVYVDTVPLINGEATSGSYEVTEFGRYRWIATYSGDARNLSATHGCDAEVVLVSRVLGSIIPNDDLPVTGLDSTVRWFGLALLALAGVLAPTLLRSRGAEAAPARRRRR